MTNREHEPVDIVSGMTICTGPDCARTDLATTEPPLCTAHYSQRKRGRDLTPLRAKRTSHRGCAVPGCERPHKAKGFCNRHYNHAKTGTPHAIGTNRAIRGAASWGCREPGCEVECSTPYCGAHGPAVPGECDSVGCAAPVASALNVYCAYHSGRNHHVRSLYGISLRQKQAIEARQDGHCAICRQAVPLHLDHNHADSRVRGMLCGPCNRGLGCFNDDPARLHAAADYLRL